MNFKKYAILYSCMLSAIIIYLFTFTSFASEKDDLILHLTFDNSIEDQSEYNNTVTPSQIQLNYDEGKFNECLQLGQDGEYLNLGTNENFNFGEDKDFSVAFWIKSDHRIYDDPVIISNKDWVDGKNTGWLVGVNNSKIEWNYKTEQGERKDMDSGLRINDGVWHFIAISHDRDGDVDFYEDGVLKRSIPIDDCKGTIDSGLSTAIGQDGTTNYNINLNSNLDDFRLYKRTLNPMEVTKMYYKGMGNSEPDKPLNQYGYNLYSGDIHSHTGYSDGQGKPDGAFEHAKNSGLGDFLVITDHSYNLELFKWGITKSKAEKYTDESFVGLRGYEFTRDWGHMNRFNTDLYKIYGDKDDFYDLIDGKDDTIAQWNHPAENEGFDDFEDYSESLDRVINLIELSNWCSERFNPFEGSYIRALDNGWHVAPTAVSDTHVGKWLTGYEQRSVILAESLSKDNIYDAMQNHRVYATEDRNIRLVYSIDDNIMGSVITPKERYNINVHIEDPDTENQKDKIERIELITNNGEVIKTKECSSHIVDWNTTITANNNSYYFVKIYTGDGQRVWSAPIWTGIDVSEVPQPSTNFIYWNFDEGKGNKTIDDWTNRVGILNGTKWVEGKKGRALHFDGKDDYVELENLVDDLKGDWTFSLWVKREDSEQSCSSICGTSKFVIRSEQYDNTDKVGFTHVGFKDYTFNYTLPEDEWVHLTFVNTKNNLSLYVNGELNSSVELEKDIKCPVEKLGCRVHYSLQEFFKGTMDEIKIYRKALNQEEIKDLLN